MVLLIIRSCVRQESHHRWPRLLWPAHLGRAHDMPSDYWCCASTRNRAPEPSPTPRPQVGEELLLVESLLATFLAVLRRAQPPSCLGSERVGRPRPLLGAAPALWVFLGSDMPASSAVFALEQPACAQNHMCAAPHTRDVHITASRNHVLRAQWAVGATRRDCTP